MDAEHLLSPMESQGCADEPKSSVGAKCQGDTPDSDVAPVPGGVHGQFRRDCARAPRAKGVNLAAVESEDKCTGKRYAN